MLSPSARLKTSGTRTVGAAETIRRAKPLAERFGLTRVADITGLDRVRIPVTSSVVPRSGDAISIYNGKGLRREHAVAGAYMEAVERQCALRAKPTLLMASAEELRVREAILEPTAILAPPAKDWRDELPFEWMECFDLISGAPVWAPAVTCAYFWRHLTGHAPHRGSTSHGLASGNCLEEAVAQALCELIERDAWTLAELGAYWHPRALAEKRRGCHVGDDFDDNFEIAPILDITGMGGAPEILLRRFRAAGLEPMIRDLTSETGIPVIAAAVAEDDVPGHPQVHMGIGAHPDPRVAAARALTEAAQSRCCDIQGVREDISTKDGEGSLTGVSHHTRRAKTIDRRRWALGYSSKPRHWTEMECHSNADILDDIRLLVSRLQRVGITQVAVADFSVRDSGLSVVRVIAPGVEQWVADRGRLGPRATAHWRRWMSNSNA